MISFVVIDIYIVSDWQNTNTTTTTHTQMDKKIKSHTYKHRNISKHKKIYTNTHICKYTNKQ